MDYRDNVFLSVVENLSFSKASQELFISQPAVTKHIKELESKLNVTLFERKGNKINLTKSGKLVYSHLKAINQQYRELEFELGRLNDTLKGSLRIGASSTISQYLMPKIIAAFHKRYPQLELYLYNGNIFTLPDQVDGENYYYFFGYPFVSISDFKLNGLQLNYYCGDWVNFFNCNSITFNPTYTGGTPSQYLIEIKACNSSCSVITGNEYINYSSGWQNGQPATNLDLRTLTDQAGLNLGNITGTVNITYQIKNACDYLRSLTHNIIVSSAPQATIVLDIYNKDNSQVYLPASHNIASPIAVGTASLGFRVNNSTGLVTYYTVKIDEVSSSGAYMKTIYNVTKNVSGVGGLTYENLNSYCVPASVWPANPGFGDCTNTSPAYNGFTGYFSKGDGQYSYLHYYKLTVTIGNSCNSSQDYSYLYVNSRNKSVEIFDVPNSNYDTYENTLSVYPNPAGEMVTFVINNNVDDHYTLTLNDMYGRVVKMLLNSQLLPAGMQTRSFNIADLSKGMYTYRLSSTSFTRKGLITKQ